MAGVTAAEATEGLGFGVRQWAGLAMAVPKVGGSLMAGREGASMACL